MPSRLSSSDSLATLILCWASLVAAGGCESTPSGPSHSGDPLTEAPTAARPSPSRLALAIDRTRARLYSDPRATSNASAMRSTDAFLSALIESAWRMSHAARYLETPRFASSKGIVGLPGLFNPDNLYRSALLEPSGVYRISGTRGSHERFTLQLLDAYPLVGLSKGLMVIDFDELGVEPGDAFEVRLGGPEPHADTEMWWPMPEDAQAVLARQTFNDWATETPSSIRIHRLDGSRDVPRGPDHADLAADFLDRITTLWADHYLAQLERLPENAFPTIRPSGEEAGGLGGQQGVITRYRLDEEEALVVVVRASDAAYQAIQLGDQWFTTQNPVRYPSSSNRSQAIVDADGLLRFVISHRVPGVANWLATAGAEHGYIMIRWQGIRTPLGDADQPRAVRVPLSEIDAHLPADSVRMTPEEREEQLSKRAHLPVLKQ